MPRKSRLPKYCFHKPSGRAYARFRGQFFYLGKYNSAASKEAYRRFVAELATTPQPAFSPSDPAETLTMVEIAAAYLDHCERYYIKNGKLSRHVDCIKQAIRRLVDLYGETPAAEFGPKALKALRQTMIDQKLSRTYINDQVDNLKRMFKWATSEQLIPSSVYEALRTVDGLRRGRSEARETAPVGPVADDVVEATLPYLPETISDMVRLQRLTGARPGEVCGLRPCDVKRSGDVWEYVPPSHKTEHQNKQRIIYLGKRAQDILRKYLLGPADECCFQPCESEQRRAADRRAARKTKIQPSQRNRRKQKPLHRPGKAYDKNSYRRAVIRGCDKAGVPRWSPNQLRHTVATLIRKNFGLEAAQVVLGHATADVTQVYAERDAALAKKIALLIG